MQQFPFDVAVEALEQSQLVNIINEDKVICVQRKVPFIKPGKSKSGSKKPKGTGFEEYWADPPLTPDEFVEEEDIYSA